MGDKLDHGVHAPVIATSTLASIELRRYKMKPGRRDDLIAIFEDQFIEGQEACEMLPFGSYRDLDDENAFVWFRGFPRFEERAASLESFYLHSDVWRANREAANDTMIDSDNVLLLRPAREHSGFDLRGTVRPSRTSSHEPQTFLWISTTLLERPASDAVVSTFERTAAPNLPGVAYFVTEERRNAFPRLPVREDEYAFVAAARCDTLEEIERCKAVIDERFIPSIVEPILRVEHARLRPTRRSLLR